MTSTIIAVVAAAVSLGAFFMTEFILRKHADEAAWRSRDLQFQIEGDRERTKRALRELSGVVGAMESDLRALIDASVDFEEEYARDGLRGGCQCRRGLEDARVLLPSGGVCE